MISWRDIWPVPVVIILMPVLTAVGFFIARADPEGLAGKSGLGAPTVEVVSPQALRCVQQVTFDAKNTPAYTARPWSRAEAETQYHQAKQYLATAEAAGLWNDTGERAVWLATAQLLEILVCWPIGRGMNP